MPLLINRSAVKKLALELALERFPAGRFTRVSGEFLLAVEGEVKESVRRKVNALPSIGKTIN